MVYTLGNTKTWQEADQICTDQFDTHLSTIQSTNDENSVIANSEHIVNQLFDVGILSNDTEDDDIEVWTGQQIIISYDECIDYYQRQYEITYADGSNYNFSLVNVRQIVIDTCNPTAAPTDSPTQAPTNAPTFSPTRAPTFSPTQAPSNAPTLAPTRAPTFSPTRAPTSPPTAHPGLPPPTAPGFDYLDRQPTKRGFAYIETTNNYRDPFSPSRAPTKTPERYFLGPIEPSPSPTKSPTNAPNYIADQCVTLVLSPKMDSNETNIIASTSKEYEYTWLTLDCDSTYLSYFSCNKFDRASYQNDGTDYFLLIEENNPKTWNEANEYCENIFGTSLSTLYDDDDQMQIVDLKDELFNDQPVNISSEFIWIGLRLDDTNFGDWKLSWSDQSVSNFSSLVSGCLTIDGTNDSLWNIELCNDKNTHNIWACNMYNPTPRPTQMPTDLIIITEQEPSGIEKLGDFIVSYPFEIIYMFILIGAFVVTIFAWIHSKSGVCCKGKCACLGFSDNAKYIAVFIFGLQIWDFMSDLSFAYNLPDKQKNPLFFWSILFIVIPWTINIIFLLAFRYKWANNREVAGWLREHTYKLVAMTMFCGGAQPSIELCNSRIFGIDLFSMGLSKYQMIQNSKFKVLLTTVLENIPQVFITVYYIVSVKGANDFAIASLISSTCSIILVIAATALMRGDNLTDQPLEIIMHYKLLSKTQKTQKRITRIGLHSYIGKQIANALGINEQMVWVDKHSIGLQTITLNVSITCNNKKGDDEMDEEEEEFISRQSTIARLNADDCKNIVDGLLNVIKLSEQELKINKMEVYPLDINGGRVYGISKVINFRKNGHKMTWDFPDKNEKSEYFQQIIDGLMNEDDDHDDDEKQTDQGIRIGRVIQEEDDDDEDDEDENDFENNKQTKQNNLGENVSIAIKTGDLKQEDEEMLTGIMNDSD